MKKITNTPQAVVARQMEPPVECELTKVKRHAR